MPFSMSNFQPLRPEQSNPVSAAITGLMKGANQAPEMIKNIYGAKYAPKMIQADMISKALAPLATIASNPFIWGNMTPEQQQNLGNVISSFMGNMNSGGSQDQSGGSSGGVGSASSLGSAISNLFGGGKQGGNPSLPQAGQGTGAGFVAQKTAPASEQVHAPGVTFFDPNNPDKTYSQAGSGLIEMSQQGYSAIKNALPNMKDIAKRAPEFLDPGSDIALYESNLAGMLSRKDPTARFGLGENKQGYIKQYAKAMGIDPEKISRYNDWKQEQITTAEMLKRALPTLATSDQAMELVMSGLSPTPGETTEGFQNRMYSSIGRAIQIADQNQENIRQAIPLNKSLGESQPSNENASEYDKYGNNTIGNPQDVINKFSARDNNSDLINSVKNTTFPKVNNDDIKLMMKKYNKSKDDILKALKNKGYDINGL